MSIFDRISIRNRLIATFTVLTALLVLTGAVGYKGMHDGFAESEMLMSEHVKPAILLGQMRFLQAENRSQIMLGLQHEPASAFIKMHDHGLALHTDTVQKNAERLTELFRQYESRKMLDPEEVALYAAFKESRIRYFEDGLKPAREALLAGEFAKANEILLKKINPLFRATAEAGQALEAHILKAGEEDQAAYGAHFKRMLGVVFAIVVVGLAIAATFGFLLIRSIALPLDRIVLHFQAIARGELTRPIEVTGDNEITRVQTSLAGMQTQLPEIVRAIDASASQIAERADGLRDDVATLLANSQRQQDGVLEVAAAMEEVSVSVAEVARSTGSAAKAANDSASEVHRGNCEVEKTIATAKEVAAAMDASVATMHSLNESVLKIDAVTLVIRDVADQTNLLALNAAIEAARAGEQGRGFAVVADEVRKLAERTASSTKDIARLLADVQSGARTATQSIDRSRARIEAVHHTAEASSEVLARVLASSGTVTHLTRDIANASAEQSLASGNVSQSLERISTLIGETHQRAGGVNAASTRLATTATELQSVVKRFQIV